MPFDHNDHYHRLVLREVPRRCRTALDVGCGTGRFARRLARPGIAVHAVDPVGGGHRGGAGRRRPGTQEAGGPRVRAGGRHRTRPAPPGTTTSASSSPASTTCRSGRSVRCARRSRRVGCRRFWAATQERSPADLVWSLAAVPVNAGVRLALAPRGGTAARHGPGSAGAPDEAARRGADGLPLAEIRRQAAVLLPGCTVRRLLFRRYLLVFRNEDVRPTPGSALSDALPRCPPPPAHHPSPSVGVPSRGKRDLSRRDCSHALCRAAPIRGAARKGHQTSAAGCAPDEWREHACRCRRPREPPGADRPRAQRRTATARRMVRAPLRDRHRAVAGRPGGAAVREPHLRRRLLRQLLPSRQAVAAGPDVLKSHEPTAGGYSSQMVLHDAAESAEDFARRRSSSTVGALEKLPEVLSVQSPLPPPGLRSPAAVRNAGGRSAVHRRAHGLHHRPLRRAALDSGRRLPARGRRRRAAAARGRCRRRVRRTAGRTGPARRGRPGERTDRVRGGDRRPADRLRQRHRGRTAPADRAGQRRRRTGRSRPARRGLHLRHRLAHPGHDDRDRRRHRLRPLPDHPSPAEPHGRRRPGALRGTRHVHQRPSRPGLRLHGDRRPRRAVRVRPSASSANSGWPPPSPSSRRSSAR